MHKAMQDVSYPFFLLQRMPMPACDPSLFLWDLESFLAFDEIVETLVLSQHLSSFSPEVRDAFLILPCSMIHLSPSLYKLNQYPSLRLLSSQYF